MASVLASTGWLACWLPARRATAIEPMAATPTRLSRTLEVDDLPKRLGKRIRETRTQRGFASQEASVQNAGGRADPPPNAAAKIAASAKRAQHEGSGRAASEGRGEKPPRAAGYRPARPHLAVMIEWPEVASVPEGIGRERSGTPRTSRRDTSRGTIIKQYRKQLRAGGGLGPLFPSRA